MLLSVLRVLLIIGLIGYVLYHLTNGFSSEMRIETARLYTENRVISAEGMIVRSERVVENSLGGVVDYRFGNGEKVGVGAKIATVYSSSENADTVRRISEIDKTLDLLDTDSSGATLTVYDGIVAGHNIASGLSDVSEAINRGEFGSVGELKDGLLGEYAEREVAISGNSANSEDRVNELERERASLVASLSGTSSSVFAPCAGYFYENVDGGENAFDYGSLKELLPSGYRECAAKIDGSDTLAVGKIVTYPRWYFVCPCNKKDAASFKVGKKYVIDFSVSDLEIDMTLDAKNEEGDELLLVFSTNIIPSGFDFLRNQKVTIVKDTVEGFRVPSTALRVVDGTVGVYVRSGNTVKFRVADVLYESGAYSFISPYTEGKTLFADDADTTNDIYCKGLSLYDDVIVSGAKELSPDRIVN